MNKIILAVCVLLLCKYSYSQECLNNGNFNQACLDAEGTYPTWTEECGIGWTRSHGSPQILQYLEANPAYPGGYYQYKYAYMWAKASEGEGMFTSYDFDANHSYKIVVQAKTALLLGQPGMGGIGKIFLYGANGLSEGPSQYGGGPPNISSSNKQLIGEYEFTSLQDWINIELTFSANKDYSQFWIYPVGSSNQTQMNLGIKTISICKDTCAGVITYNNGAQTLPIGKYRAAKINIGSSAGTGGNGTVTAAFDFVTELVASEEITLYPETLIHMNQSGEFSASIIPCPPINTRKAREQSDSGAIKNSEHLTITPKKKLFEIYPRSTNGAITIKFLTQVSNNDEVIVYDISGRKVHRQIIAKSQNVVQLNLGHLINGVYIVQVKNQNGMASEKIVVNK